MAKLVNDFCPLGKTECRHCSIAYAIREYTRVEKDVKTKLFKPVGRGRKKVEIGEYCNDAGKYVADMNYCPIQWDKAKKGKRYHG